MLSMRIILYEAQIFIRTFSFYRKLLPSTIKVVSSDFVLTVDISD